jgi:putative lipoic acid-binding regulatory protein
MEYPLLYVFRFVAKRLPDVRARIKTLVELELGPLPDDAVTERDSSAGKYAAVHVTCLLQREEQRRAVYLRVRAEPWVLLGL